MYANGIFPPSLQRGSRVPTQVPMHRNAPCYMPEDSRNLKLNQQNMRHMECDPNLTMQPASNMSMDVFSQQSVAMGNPYMNHSQVFVQPNEMPWGNFNSSQQSSFPVQYPQPIRNSEEHPSQPNSLSSMRRQMELFRSSQRTEQDSSQIFRSPTPKIADNAGKWKPDDEQLRSVRFKRNMEVLPVTVDQTGMRYLPVTGPEGDFYKCAFCDVKRVYVSIEHLKMHAKRCPGYKPSGSDTKLDSFDVESHAKATKRGFSKPAALPKQSIPDSVDSIKLKTAKSPDSVSSISSEDAARILTKISQRSQTNDRPESAILSQKCKENEAECNVDRLSQRDTAEGSIVSSQRFSQNRIAHNYDFSLPDSPEGMTPLDNQSKEQMVGPPSETVWISHGSQGKNRSFVCQDITEIKENCSPNIRFEQPLKIGDSRSQLIQEKEQKICQDYYFPQSKTVQEKTIFPEKHIQAPSQSNTAGTFSMVLSTKKDLVDVNEQRNGIISRTNGGPISCSNEEAFIETRVMQQRTIGWSDVMDQCQAAEEEMYSVRQFDNQQSLQPQHEREGGFFVGEENITEQTNNHVENSEKSTDDEPRFDDYMSMQIRPVTQDPPSKVVPKRKMNACATPRKKTAPKLLALPAPGCSVTTQTERPCAVIYRDAGAQTSPMLPQLARTCTLMHEKSSFFEIVRKERKKYKRKVPKESSESRDVRKVGRGPRKGKERKNLVSPGSAVNELMNGKSIGLNKHKERKVSPKKGPIARAQSEKPRMVTPVVQSNDTIATRIRQRNRITRNCGIDLKGLFLEDPVALQGSHVMYRNKFADLWKFGKILRYSSKAKTHTVKLNDGLNVNVDFSSLELRSAETF